MEEADFERARKHQARAAAALGEFVDGMPKVMPAGSSLHYMGTVRMGAADDGTSVCDSYSRVWACPASCRRQRPDPDGQLDEPDADQRRSLAARRRSPPTSRRRTDRARLPDHPGARLPQRRGRGRITGFSFQLRNPNYRGGPASMLDGIEVVVDGERIPDHVPLWTIQGRTFTLDELRASTDVRWQLDEPATITVPKAGRPGGVHRIEATLYLRRSYFPPMVRGRSSPSPARRDRPAGARTAA